MTNPAGAAVVVRGEDKIQRRHLVIVPGMVGSLGAPVQVQSE